MKHKPEGFVPSCRFAIRGVEEINWDPKSTPATNGSADGFSCLTSFFGYGGHRALLTAEACLLVVWEASNVTRALLRVDGTVSSDNPSIGRAAVRHWFESGIARVRNQLCRHAKSKAAGPWEFVYHFEDGGQNSRRLAIAINMSWREATPMEIAEILGE